MADIFASMMGASTDHAKYVMPLLVYGFLVERVADAQRVVVRILEHLPAV